MGWGCPGWPRGKESCLEPFSRPPMCGNLPPTLTVSSWSLLLLFPNCLHSSPCDGGQGASIPQTRPAGLSAPSYGMLQVTRPTWQVWKPALACCHRPHRGGPSVPVPGAAEVGAVPRLCVHKDSGQRHPQLIILLEPRAGGHGLTIHPIRWQAALPSCWCISDSTAFHGFCSRRPVSCPAGSLLTTVPCDLLDHCSPVNPRGTGRFLCSAGRRWTTGCLGLPGPLGPTLRTGGVDSSSRALEADVQDQAAVVLAPSQALRKAACRPGVVGAPRHSPGGLEHGVGAHVFAVGLRRNWFCLQLPAVSPDKVQGPGVSTTT